MPVEKEIGDMSKGLLSLLQGLGRNSKSVSKKLEKRITDPRDDDGMVFTFACPRRCGRQRVSSFLLVDRVHFFFESNFVRVGVQNPM